MSFLRSWRIWRKMLIVLGVIGVLCVSLVAVGAYDFNALAVIAENLVTRTTADLRLSRSARMHMAIAHLGAFELSDGEIDSARGRAALQKMRNERQELGADLAALRKVEDPADLRPFNEALAGVADYDTAISHLQALLREHRHSEVVDTVLSEVGAASNKVDAALDTIVSRHLRELAAADAVAQNAAKNATWRMIGTSVLGLLSVLALAIFIVRREITKPLEAVTNSINRLVEGDIESTVAGKERGDEIGELARAFIAFRRREASFRSLTANVPGIVYRRVRHADGRIEYPFMSDGIREMLGFDPQAITTQPGLMLGTMHEEDRERYRAAITSSAETLGPLDIEFRHLRKDGQVRWIHVVSRPRRGERGSIIWDCLGLDTTENHDIRCALRENEERIRSIAENLPGFVFQCFADANGSLRFKLFRTPRFNFSSFQSEDVAEGECAMSDFVHPEDRTKLKDCIFAACADGTDWNETIRVMSPDGPDRWVHATALFRDRVAGKSVWDGIAIDETDRIATTAANARLQAKLRQAEKLEAIGTLAGGVAHELNNLLQPIIMMTELVLIELPADDPRGANLSQVVDAGNKAAEIVQRILSFGRADEASHDPLDIAQVVREASSFIRTILPSTINFHIDIGAGIGTVRGDKTQLTQILINMATNARDAIGPKIGTMWVSLSRLNAWEPKPNTAVGALQGGSYALLTVRDTGAGMDEATKARIFEPFFTTKGVGKGTGLGLSVTHGIITGHGGALHVESTPGRGTAFFIYLPLEETGASLALAG